MKMICALLTFVAMGTALCIAAETVALKWPREIDIPEAKIVMYQPQLESFEGNRLTCRAAVAVTPQGRTEPVFGAVWIDARVSTDRDNRIVRCLDIDVGEVKFPNADPARIEKLKGILESEIPKWDLTISLDGLLTMLDLIEKEKAAAAQLNTTPPKIIFTTHPAVLVTINGDPKLQKTKDSDLIRVVNTPFFIVFEPKTKLYYLKGGQDWLAATDIKGPWQASTQTPDSVISAAKSPDATQEQIEQPQLDRMPQVVVATEPTELIVLDGPARFSTIYGTDLLYLSNTKSDLLAHIGSQDYFLLLSGRWYTSAELDGEWSYVPGDKLPPDFAKIPAGSAKANVLSSVPDTQQAREAVLDVQIPQTATVKRSEAKLAVIYDGNPKFVKIHDTDMLYAANTSYSVIQYGGKYYCCDKGVWFVSDSPPGPWRICVAVPQVIYIIPPGCPIYNVKYVYVYGSTPDVVYVGYTTGYMGSYVYGGAVVYGTGYVYPAWCGTYYYPRPVTYGYGAVYNPYNGWAFAAGVATGWIASNVHHGGWWGARGFRDVDIDINRNINFNNNRSNIYNRRRNLAHRPGGRPVAGRPGAGKPGPGPARPPAARPSMRPSTRPNNVYADRNGNTFCKTYSGWQKRDRGGWASARPSTSRPLTPSVERDRPDRGRNRQRDFSNLNRHNSARQRGSSRSRDFNQSRRSGGGRSGGGGRGRR
ncbi:MAG: hypothetical protein J7M40_20230 [Planctomycetes bacterium]|nr:hypothetical protein [Planctomycetota bacterium]